MSRASVSRCVGCTCTDEKRCVGGCRWALVDVFARVGICSRCFANPAGREDLRAKFVLEGKKARATCASKEVA